MAVIFMKASVKLSSPRLLLLCRRTPRERSSAPAGAGRARAKRSGPLWGRSLTRAQPGSALLRRRLVRVARVAARVRRSHAVRHLTRRAIGIGVGGRVRGDAADLLVT